MTKQVWLPLAAATRAEAIKQARLKEVWLESLYEEARGEVRGSHLNAPPQRPATLENLRRAVQTYFHRLEQGAETVPLDDYERQIVLDRAIDDASGMTAQPTEDGNLQLVAKSVAAQAGLTLPPGSPLVHEVAGMVKAALVEHFNREVERAALQPIGQRHPLFNGITPETPPPRTMTVEEAIAAFKVERAGVTPATVQARRFKFAAWQELLGPDKPIALVTRQDIKTARDMLMKVPAHATQRHPGKSLRDLVKLAERDGLPGMSSKSVRLYLETLASLFRWLRNEGHIVENWAIGISAPAGSKDDPRRPFTTAELQRLFTTGPYATAASSSRTWAFWAPLIALFHGLRSAEILGLEARDVATEDSVIVFKVRHNAARRLKNDQSERIVPLHPELISLGFVAYVSKQSAAGLLFPDLPGDKGPSIDAAGKVLMRWIRNSFPDPDLVFQSFRHTWTDALREAEIPDEIQERLGGWKLPGRSARGGYGMGAKPERLAVEIAKVRFAGLDLSPLRQLTLDRSGEGAETSGECGARDRA